MKVSVVIPAYNQAEFLPDAIESALSQTLYPDDCEVIVVNDGSTDATAEIVKNYPVKAVHQVNKGLASARNTGIMNATGEYILPLDADDLLEDNCAEKLYGIAEQTKADVVAPSFKCFGKHQDLVILIPSPSLEDFKVGNRIGYCSLIKRATLLEVGGYSPKMVWGFEDYHLWFDLLRRGKRIVTTPDVLWLYRTKEHSMIHDANEHREELMAQIKKDHGV